MASSILFKNFSFNQVVKILTLSDTLIFSGFGFLNPVFAVFITDQIQGGDLQVVGFASGVFLAVKSVLQIPFGSYIDLKKGEKDDFRVLLIGSLIIGLSPFLYLFSALAWHIYLIQALYGLGSAMAYVSWMAIFTRHVDQGSEASDWGIYSSLVGVCSAITAGVGGIVAQQLGFNNLFILVGFTSLIGVVLLLFIRTKIVSQPLRSH